MASGRRGGNTFVSSHPMPPANQNSGRETTRTATPRNRFKTRFWRSIAIRVTFYKYRQSVGEKSRFRLEKLLLFSPLIPIPTREAFGGQVTAAPRAVVRRLIATSTDFPILAIAKRLLGLMLFLRRGRISRSASLASMLKELLAKHRHFTHDRIVGVIGLLTTFMFSCSSCFCRYPKRPGEAYPDTNL